MPDAPAPAPTPDDDVLGTEALDARTVIREARAFLDLQRGMVGGSLFLGETDPAATPPAAPAAAPVAAPVETRDPATPDPATPDPATPEVAQPEAAPLEATAAPADTPSAPAADPADPETSEPTDSDVPDLFGELPDPSQDPTLSPYERVASLVPEDHPLREMDTLGEIRDWLARTVLVPIDEGRLNPVLGVGPEDADLMVIGEAPGADEDKTGEPFVGRAGQLLDKILDAVLFDRDEVYITNILKSRPPGNRDPQAEEVEAHLPILHRQIAIVKPKIILAVGKSAGNGLLGRSSSLASLRGKPHDYYGIPLVVTYHPAALLRNPQWKRPTWEDVKLLRTRYDELGGRSRRSA